MKLICTNKIDHLNPICVFFLAMQDSTVAVLLSDNPVLLLKSARLKGGLHPLLIKISTQPQNWDNHPSTISLSYGFTVSVKVFN